MWKLYHFHLWKMSKHLTKWDFIKRENVHFLIGEYLGSKSESKGTGKALLHLGSRIIGVLFRFILSFHHLALYMGNLDYTLLFVSQPPFFHIILVLDKRASRLADHLRVCSDGLASALSSNLHLRRIIIIYNLSFMRTFQVVMMFIKARDSILIVKYLFWCSNLLIFKR